MSGTLQGIALPGPDAKRWRKVRRLLVVRLDNLGDLLMTTPALVALRESLPAAHITLLGSPSGAAAARHLPMVDEAWVFDAPWSKQPAPDSDVDCPWRRGAPHDEGTLVDRLAEARFDAAVIFTVCTQSALPMALLCRMADIPLRLAHCRENPYALLSDWVPEPDTIGSTVRHEVERQLALVASVGMHARDAGLRFALHADDRQRVCERLAAAGLDPSRPYAVMHPGATAPSRRWPAASFGVAAERLCADGLCQVVFSGDAGDVVAVEQARAAMAPGARAASVSLAGQLGLGELAALIEGACVLVANNSAPSHLAAALGTPVVTLYALTNPQHTPWQVPSAVLSHDVPCRWCLKSVCPEQHHACLRRVEPHTVADAARGLIRASLPHAPPPALPHALLQALVHPSTETQP